MSKKVINQDNKSNKMINIIVIGCAFLLVVALGVMVSKNKQSALYNHIKEIGYSDYIEKINSKDYTIILLATPDCQYCIKYKPFMNQVAVDYDLEINYIDVSSNDLSIDEYTALHDKYSVLKDKYDDTEGYPIIPTPTTIIVKDGEEVASRSGNIGYDGFLKMLKENGVV